MKRQLRQFLLLLTAVSMLSACASQHSHIDDAIGGALGGGLAGGAVGTACCGDPVHSLPAGILVGALAGLIIGYIWPTKADQKTNYNP